MPYQVRKSGSLLDALERMFEGRSRRNLRRLVQERRIRINGKTADDARSRVKVGDLVECTPFGRPKAIHPKVRLVYEDRQLLVVDKDVGILTSGGVPGKLPTVRDVLKRSLAQRHIRGDVFPCHRLDRDVSGLLLFARTAALALQVRAAPRRYLRERVYHALVEGIPQKTEDTVTSYLKEGENLLVRVSEATAAGAKRCVSHYRVLATGRRHSVLEVRLETGRKHQIRAQLSHLGHPVAGDRRYGARSDPARRVALHARRLVVLHPLTGEKLEFESPPPATLRVPT